MLCFHLVQGSRFRGEVAASPLFLLGRCPEVAFKLPVTPTIRGEWIVSHAWYEILRLSPHLSWRELFSHRAFSSVQDDDTGERKGFHLGDTLRVLELSVLYTIRVGPWRRAAPKAQDRVPRRGTTLRSGMKNDMRRSVFLACHEGRSGGIFLADR